MSELAQLLEKLRARIHAEVRVALPARVESYDAGRQLASVKPLVQDAYRDAEGAERTRSLPVVSNVPVCWPSGGGGFLTFPLAKGDTVLLVFADRSLDRWLSLGTEVDPVDVRTHHLTDAIAVPGLHATTASLTTSATDVVMWLPPGAELHVAGAVDAAALASGTDGALETIRLAINGIAPGAIPLPFPSVASERLKVGS